MQIRLKLFACAIAVLSASPARAYGNGEKPVVARPGAPPADPVRIYDSRKVRLDPNQLPKNLGRALSEGEKVAAELGSAAIGLEAADAKLAALAPLLRAAARSTGGLSVAQREMFESSSARLVEAIKKLNGISVGEADDDVKLSRVEESLQVVNEFLHATKQDPIFVSVEPLNGKLTLVAKEMYDVDPKAAHRAVRPGAQPIQGAPKLMLKDGSVHVSDLSMVHNWTKKTVKEAVGRISYRSEFPVFVGSDKGMPYIQIGMITPDNYPHALKDVPEEIVYGRRFYLAKYIRRSEVFQTVLLGLMSAVEHEEREKLTWANPDRGNKKTTQGSTHVDAPLYASWKRVNQDQVENPVMTDLPSVQKLMEQFKYNERALIVSQADTLPGGRMLLRVRIGAKPEGHRPELLDGKELSFLTEGNTASDVAYGVLDEIVRVARREVEDHMLIDGQTRFNRKEDTWQRLGAFSGAVWGEGRINSHPDHQRIYDRMFDGRAPLMTPEGGPIAGKHLHGEKISGDGKLYDPDAVEGKKIP